jgi:Tol biopolymer transport system component
MLASMKRGSSGLAAVAAILAVLAVASPAQATFPGRNAEIAYIDVWGSDVEISTDLYRVCASGSHDRKLLSGGAWDTGSVAFSPNGRWLAADGHIDYNDDSHISVGAVTGKRLRRVSRPPRRARDTGPAWSPRGSALAFTRTRYDRDYDLRSTAVRIYRNGGGRFLARGFAPAWSVRDEIAFVRGTPDDSTTQQIYVTSVRGGAARRLATGYAPQWSPDGRRLVISHRVPGYTPAPYFKPAVDIAVISADGTGQRRLAGGDGASWSPDGRRIAFVTPDRYAAIISPSGRGLWRLGRADSAPVFSPDSRWLATTWKDDLYVVRLDGGRRRYVTSPSSGEDLSLQDWRPLTSESPSSSLENRANARPLTLCR